MPKIKTHRATAKRFRLTATNKLKKRKSGQDHFNSRETGNTKRAKRLDINADATLVKTIKTLTPYR
ncbi:MAG: 50S ribosomal protein L35 [Patescibacteria group bacterium]|nr:50S ribosomal protein L35 [Patescibacteria group bacterium]